MRLVESHNEVQEGDFLLYEDRGKESIVLLLEAKEEQLAIREVARQMPFYLIHSVPVMGDVNLRLVEYISPLRQRRVREIKLSK